MSSRKDEFVTLAAHVTDLRQVYQIDHDFHERKKTIPFADCLPTNARFDIRMTRTLKAFWHATAILLLFLPLKRHWSVYKSSEYVAREILKSLCREMKGHDEEYPKSVKNVKRRISCFITEFRS